MTEHSTEVIQLLLWLIVLVGGGLLAMLAWTWKRVQNKVDVLPQEIALKVQTVHEEIVAEMKEMNATQAALERDLRSQFTKLDRRVIRLEVLQDVRHKPEDE
jgi:hypothetical protein